MNSKPLTPGLSMSPQLSETDVAAAARAGVRSIIANRPDGEEPGQPSAATLAAVAANHGIAFEHIPVTLNAISTADVERMADALRHLPEPMLAYCRTGTRSAALWALTRSGKEDPEALLVAASAAGYDLNAVRARLAPVIPSGGADAVVRVYDVVIIGGGAAGVASAASLLKRRPALDIAIVEPAETHDYQPGWTMVGAGVFAPGATRRPMASVMPDRCHWIRQAAAGLAPETAEVVLADGSSLRYRVLIVAPGLKLDWEAIPGLSDALGRNGVTSNYRFDLAPYTHELVSRLKHGRALFTQPAMPIKCAGAPQKAMYLSCDLWRRAGVLGDIEVEFHNAGAVLFGVSTYVPALMEYVERYGIALRPQSRLIAVDGAARVATFETNAADGDVSRTKREFDLLHAVPPQVAPAFVAQSSLASANGFVDVDPATLRNPSFGNVFSLGDACSAPNAKTAAAVRKQAPIVALNVLATLDSRPLPATYDGYGSCPLTVELGKIVLAEFGYGGALLPSFPKWLLDGTRPSRLAWLLKERVLPPLYWHAMLRGREWLVAPASAK